jgi:ribosome-binding factor A
LEQTLERIKKPLRWEITDKLSYLRNSPEIVFKYDEDSDCRKDQ